MDGAFKLQENKLTRTASAAKSKVEGKLPGPSYDHIAASTDGLENVTHTDAGYGNAPDALNSQDGLEVLCGPLLNYKSMSNRGSHMPVWHGSVLIVAKPGNRQPGLYLKCINLSRSGQNSTLSIGLANKEQERSIQGIQLYVDTTKAFWRFDLELELQESEARWEYLIPDLIYPSGASSRTSSTQSFVVPGAFESMRIMFHSCNGFSVGTDEEAWSGPALWNDVLRVHEKKPFHVMIGGGDQIYNDGVRVGDGPLFPWTQISSPKKRRDYEFDEHLREGCDVFYFNNYVKWFSHEPFATANSQIPQINVWDDHGNILHDISQMATNH